MLAQPNQHTTYTKLQQRLMGAAIWLSFWAVAVCALYFASKLVGD
jgi:hypothetical protein